MSHTPGPWTVVEYGDDDAPALVIHKDTNSRVCFMATPGSHGDPAMIEADARLIAAAPDMLAAIGPSEGGTATFADELLVVANIIDVYDKGSGLGRHLRERAEAIRAAIAKATGAAP